MEKKTEKKTTDMIVKLVASLTGLNIVNATTAVIAYQKIFSRCERPDYTLMAGEYSYERVKDRLRRSEVKFKSGKNILTGYYYPSRRKRGLVIITHGIRSGADDYIPMAEYLVKNGYCVFSYDVTGTYSSEGTSTVGMCQSLIDLESAIKFVSREEPYKKLPLYLIGHSWGAYATGAVLNLCRGIKINACALISGMDRGSKMLVEKAREYVGSLASLPESTFDVYQRILFDKYVSYTATDGINARNIPTIIAHGVDDKVIRFNNQAIISFKEKIKNPHVTYYVGKGLVGTHNGIWHSKESVIYQMETKSELALLEMTKGKPLDENEKREFYKTVDHKLYSEVNKELFDLIIKVFNGSTGKFW